MGCLRAMRVSSRSRRRVKVLAAAIGVGGDGLDLSRNSGAVSKLVCGGGHA